MQNFTLMQQIVVHKLVSQLKKQRNYH